MDGSDLQEIRSKLGMTQPAFALAVNISPRTVSRYEAQNQVVPHYVVERILDLQRDDGMSLARVSTRRLAEELARRVALWDEDVHHSKS